LTYDALQVKYSAYTNTIICFKFITGAY